MMGKVLSDKLSVCGQVFWRGEGGGGWDAHLRVKLSIKT